MCLKNFFKNKEIYNVNVDNLDYYWLNIHESSRNKMPVFYVNWFSSVYVNDVWCMCSYTSLDCLVTYTFITVYNFVYN